MSDRILKFAGYTKVKAIYFDEEGEKMCEFNWQYPDGAIDIEPELNLELLFEYVIPKLKGLNVIIMLNVKHGVYTVSIAGLDKEWWSKDKDIKVALKSAIEKYLEDKE